MNKSEGRTASLTGGAGWIPAGTDRSGIDDGYEDARGAWRPIRPETRTAILAAMGVAPTSPGPGDGDRVLVLRQGEDPALPSPGALRLEDGTTLDVAGRLPCDLPLGYHDLHLNGRTLRVIVSPGRCHPPPARAWGWSVQLYSTRSRMSWGIGDFEDLRRLGRWSTELGAQVLMVNPLHAAVPRTPEDPSPYAPSSRRYRNPLYLRIEEVPGAGELAAEMERLAAPGRAMNAERHIDREAVGRLKREALERLWARFGSDPDFDRYRAEEGRALETFAIFSTLAEHHRRGWREWPAEHRHPESPGVARFAAERHDRVGFHQWVQWLCDRQLGRAAHEVALVHDLPVGVDPDGADAWAWQDVLATGASVGAPPDPFNARGQDWGLPPFVPHRLRARAYEPFIATLRGVLRHGGGLRIDHVMGLFRLFWVPRGLEPADGGYVRYPADDLLAILALESHRARAFIVGEDLGTIERGVRERLADAGVLGTRVLWFEGARPGEWPPLALATVTTHDLPTIAGLWNGSDFEAQRRMGLGPSPEAYGETRRRLGAWSGMPDGGPVPAVIEAAYRALGRVPSAIVTATLEDALAVEERPNMPGTTTAWPNWRLALPSPIEALAEAPLALAVARALDERRRLT